MNLQWPRSERRPYILPWYRIGWNCLWFPVYLAGLVVMSTAVLAIGGPKSVAELWNDRGMVS